MNLCSDSQYHFQFRVHFTLIIVLKNEKKGVIEAVNQMDVCLVTVFVAILLRCTLERLLMQIPMLKSLIVET